MPYSAVTQPPPVPRRNAGTRSSMLTVQSTQVLPNFTIAEPSAWSRKFGSIVTGRIWSGLRPSCRANVLLLRRYAVRNR